MLNHSICIPNCVVQDVCCSAHMDFRNAVQREEHSKIKANAALCTIDKVCNFLSIFQFDFMIICVDHFAKDSEKMDS